MLVLVEMKPECDIVKCSKWRMVLHYQELESVLPRSFELLVNFFLYIFSIGCCCKLTLEFLSTFHNPTRLEQWSKCINLVIGFTKKGKNNYTKIKRYFRQISLFYFQIKLSFYIDPNTILIPHYTHFNPYLTR